MRQSLVRIASAQKCEAGAKFLECLDLKHIDVLHWAGLTSPAGAIPRRGLSIKRR
jgi:hypothetical protein